MQTHAFDCEWCSVVQRLTFVEKRLGLTHIQENHGSSEAIPDTQRSGDTERFCWKCRTRTQHPGDCLWCGAPDRASELHADSRPTEPCDPPDAGADAAARGPEGAEPGS
jgi:hypothetical protein